MQSQIFRYMGYKSLEKCYSYGADIEWYFVGKFIYRILYLGGEPKNEEKEAHQIFIDPVECLEYDLMAAKNGFYWLRKVLETAKDDVATYDLLRYYYKNQERMIHWYEKQLEYINKIGIENYLLHRIEANDRTLEKNSLNSDIDIKEHLSKDAREMKRFSNF